MASRGAAQEATAGVRAVGVYSFAPNKANLPRCWPGNEGRAREQSQSGRAMAPTQIRSTKSETCPERSRMDPDKCEARMRKTTETLSPGGRNVWEFGFGCFELVSGFDTRSSSLPLWALAPNKANLKRFRAENEGRAEKESQFRRMRASAQIRSTKSEIRDKFEKRRIQITKTLPPLPAPGRSAPLSANIVSILLSAPADIVISSTDAKERASADSAIGSGPRRRRSLP